MRLGACGRQRAGALPVPRTLLCRTEHLKIVEAARSVGLRRAGASGEGKLSTGVRRVMNFANKGTIDIQPKVTAIRDSQQRIFLPARFNCLATRWGNEILIGRASTGVMAAEEELAQVSDLEIVELFAVEAQKHPGVTAR